MCHRHSSGSCEVTVIATLHSKPILDCRGYFVTRNNAKMNNLLAHSNQLTVSTHP